MESCKRLISLLLVFAMVVSYVPAPVAAEAVVEEIVEEVVTEEVIEELPETDVIEEVTEEIIEELPEEVVEEIIEEEIPELTEEEPQTTIALDPVTDDAAGAATDETVTYALTIAGTAVTSAALSGTGWRYDPDQDVLYLEEGFSGAIRSTDESLTIEVNGAVKTAGISATQGSLTLRGKTGRDVDSLTSALVQVKGSGNVLRVENLTLSATTESSYASAIMAGSVDDNGTDCEGDLIIQNASVSGYAKGNNSYHGIHTGTIQVLGDSYVYGRASRSGLCGIYAQAETGSSFSAQCHVQTSTPPGTSIRIYGITLPESAYICDSGVYGGVYQKVDTGALSTLSGGMNYTFLGLEHASYQQNDDGKTHALKCACGDTALSDPEECAGEDGSCAVCGGSLSTIGGTCGENVTWSFDPETGTLTISGTGDMYDYTSNSDVPWWGYQQDIAAVVVTSGVTSLGSNAFNGRGNYNGDYYKKLSSVDLGDTVETIGEMAFQDCTALTSVVLPDSVTQLGGDVFNGCYYLQSVTLSENLETVNDFAGCRSLASITIPESVTTVDGFRNSGLVSVTLPDSVTAIGESAFEGCWKLTNVTLSQNLQTIGFAAFRNCSVLGEVTVPASVTQVQDNAFDSIQLKAVIQFEGSAPEFGDRAFSFSVVTVRYPADDPSWSSCVGKNYNGTITWEPVKNYVAQGQCGAQGDNLTWTLDEAGTLTISGEGEMADTYWPYESLNTATEFAPWHPYAENIRTVVAEPGVTSISHFAFYDCTNLKTVVLSEGVVRVGCAFVGSGLEELTIPASVTNLSYPSNEGVCSGLKKIHVAEGNTAYSSDAAGLLYNKEQTKLIGCPTGYAGACDIADTVTEIGDWAFNSCSAVTSVDIPAGVTKIGLAAFIGCAELTELTIPEGVSTIGMMALSGTGLTSLVIPASVKAIGGSAFADSNNLTQLYFEGSAPTFEYDSFYNLEATVYYPADDAAWTAAVQDDYSGTIKWVPVKDYVAQGQCGAQGDNLTWTLDEEGRLTISGTGEMADFTYDGAPWVDYREQITEVTIADTVTGIGSYAFEKCTALKRVTIGEGVTRLGGRSFYSCVQLEQINLNAAKLQDLATYNNVFYYGGSQTDGITVNVGAKVERIPANLFAPFAGSYEPKITRVTFAEGSACTSIGSHAFRGIPDLTELTLPEGLTHIDSYAFYLDTNLKAVDLPDTLQVLGDYAFYNCSALEDLVLPESLTDIGRSAFYYCSQLKELTLPGSLTSIGNKAFGKAGVQMVVFNGSAPAIAADAFADVTAKAYYPGDNDTWTEEIRQSYGGELTWVKLLGGDHTHEYEQVVVEGTCQEPGYTNHVCIYCGDSYKDNYVTVGHIYLEEVHPVTCQEDGYTRFTCKFCGDWYDDAFVEATGRHNYEKTVHEATCAELGYTEYFCPDCGDGYTDSYVQGEHDYVSKVYEGTCVQPGYTEYSCRNCPDSYKTDFVAGAHDYSAVVHAPTCWDCGYTEYTCKNCADTYRDQYVNSAHDYETTEHVPTCTGMGCVEHTCKNCGDSYRDQYVLPLGHSYAVQAVPEENRILYTCTRCEDSYTREITMWDVPCEHEYRTTVMEPACGEMGYTEYSCDLCGDWYLTDVTQGEHAYTTQTVDPTCQAPGYTRYTCIHCEHWYDDHYTYADHEYKTEVIAPTCQEAGYTRYTCVTCGDWYDDHYTEGEHPYTATVYAPTCEEDGYTEYVCTACGDSYISDIVSRLEHSYQEEIFEPAEEEAGYTRFTCEDCGVWYDTNFTGRPDCDHDFRIQVIRATCTSRGYTRYACRNCSFTLEMDYVSPKHSYVTKVVEPNCAKRGYTEYFCVNCGEKHQGDYTEPAHDYHETTVPPTCTEVGYTRYFCVECGKVECQDYTQRAEHAFDTVIVPPTCIKQGYTQYTCADCGYRFSQNWTPSVHNYVMHTVPATCEKRGYQLYSCTACGKAYTDSYTQQAEHSFGSWQVLVPATREESGIERRFCSHCGQCEERELIWTGPATSGTCGEQLVWNFDTETGLLTISGSGAMKDYVIGAEAPWYDLQDVILAVTLDEGVTSVGSYAFGEDNLQTYAKLAQVSFPQTLTKIGEGAFQACTALTQIVLPDSVTELGSGAFEDCHSLKTVTLSENLKEIYAFRNCYALESITLPEGVENVGYFMNTGLKEIVLPDSVTQIGTSAFEGSALERVVLSENLKSIPSYAFALCTQLKDITIPASVQEIGNEAFGSTGLEEITFAGSAPDIWSIGFFNTTATVNYPGADPSWTYTREDYGGNLTWEPYYRVVADGKTGTAHWVLMDSGVLTVSGGAMADYAARSEEPWDDYRSQIKSIVIEDDVTRIGNYAFYYCNSTTELTIGQGVTEIGDYAFCYCQSLEQIHIPDSVQTIGYAAFYGCARASALTIGESVTGIGNSAFWGCTSLTRIDYNAAALADLPASNKVFYNAGQGNSGITLNVGSKVEQLPARLFDPYSSYVYAPDVVAVNFQENSVLARIGDYAFRNMPLKELVIPDSVTSIGYQAFEGCGALTTLTIGKGVQTIANNAFRGCNYLTRINYNAVNASDLPNSNYVFHNAGSDSGGIAVYIGAEVQRIPARLFYPYNGNYDADITAVYFAEDGICTEVGSAAFREIDTLTEIRLADSITTVGSYAFAQNKALTHVTLPDSLETVGEYAFGMNPKLTILCPKDLPENLGSDWSSQAAVCVDPVSYGTADDFTWWITREDALILGKYYGSDPAVTVPETVEGRPVTILGPSIFEANTTLTSVTLPASVTTLEDRALFGCTKLTEMTLPGGLQSIGSKCFAECSKLTALTMPASVTYVGDYFRQNSGTKTVTFVGDAPEFASNAFSSGTVTAIYPSGNTSWTSDVKQNYGGTVSWVEMAADGSYTGKCGTNLTWTLDAEGLLSITGTGAMDSYTNRSAPWYGLWEQITGLTIAEGVTTIGSAAFLDLVNLTGTVRIPDSVTTIGSNAFYGCDGLEGVTLGSGVSVIKSYAFNSCDNLSGELVIPDSVMTIEYCAFAGCGQLTAIRFGKNLTALSSSPYQNTTSYFPFYNCTGVTEMTFSGVVPAAIYGNFKTLTALETVYVPAGSLAAYEEALSGKLPENTVIAADPNSPVGALAAPQVYSKSVLLTWAVHPAAEGYVISRNGEAVGESAECRFADTGLELGTTYVYSVQARVGSSLTGPTELVVTTVAPELADIATASSRNKLNETKNQITVTAADKGNLLPLEERETTVALYYLVQDEKILIGQGTLTGTEFTAAWDITGLDDGSYPVLARLTDIDGTVAERTEIIHIDRSGPSAITGLFAQANVTQIDLTWKQANELDTVRYNVYRKAEGETDFTCIATVEGHENCAFTDKNVETNGVYSYQVRGINELDVVGEASNTAIATLTPDDTDPEIDYLTPANGTVIHGEKVTLQVHASDNVCVTGITLLYSVDGKDWTELAQLDSGVTSFVLNTRNLPVQDGVIHIQAIAQDAAGNVSEPKSYLYTVDNVGPDPVRNLRWEATTVTATLRWDNVQAADIYRFQVEWQREDGSWIVLSNIYDTLGINLKSLTPGNSYTYRVTAYDKLGNGSIPSEPVTVTTKADTNGPVITRLRPDANYYSTSIPLSIEVSDDYSVASISVQTSRDRLNWQEVTVRNYENIQAKRTLTYTLQLADYAEGDLYVRAVATDALGNVGDSGINAPFVQYVVDKSAPAAPANVQAMGFGGYVEVCWDQGSEKDLSSYRVYRSETEDGPYVLKGSGLKTVNYIDKTALLGVTYYYQVQAVDKAGNAGALSETVSAQVKADIEKPVIRSVYPADGAHVRPGNSSINVSAQDNSGVAYIYFERMNADGTDYELWHTLDTSESQEPPELDVSGLDHGTQVRVRIRAKDIAGQVSEDVYVTYLVDLEAPEADNVRASYNENADQVILTWNGRGEADLDRYRVYRSQDGKELQIGYCSAGNYKLENGQRVFTFLDGALTKEKVTYSYRIEAVDQCGNTRSHAPVTVELADRRVPKAVITGDSTMELGREYQLDGSGSVSNGKALTYSWNFGDGCTADTAKPIHAYEQTGEYTVTLTVTDSDGLESVAEQKVTVSDPTDTGTAVIQILDEEGNPVPDAPVYFDLGAENQVVKKTDGNGLAIFTAAPGKHIVGCVIPDNQWLPVQKEILITAGHESGLAMTLVKQALVTGEFTANRMTFDEIVAAGIDTSKPENSHLMKADVTLSFGTSKVVQTSFIFDTNGKIVIPGGGGSDGSFILPSEDPEEDPRILVPTVLNPNNEKAMTIAFLDMPLEASFLKEFFDVKLHILNNAGSDFPLVNNVVTLHVPDGLSLVEGTETENTATVVVDTIGGGTSHSVNWILRGDNPGSYDLVADYSGTLAGFNEQINAEFRSEKAVQVYGMDVVKLEARISPNINYGAFYFDLSMENDSVINVNLPNVDIGDDVIASYLIRVNEAAEGKDDTLITQKEPRVEHLSTILENNTGARQQLSADSVVSTLQPGEKLTKRFAVYNVVDYNNQLLLIGALQQVQQQTGLRFQVVLADMDLFDTDNAADKLAALAGDKKAMYDYILDGSNFFYVKQAVNRDDGYLEKISAFQFADVWNAMELDQADEAAVRAITRKLVGQLMVDDALAEAINGHIDQKYKQLVSKITKEIQDYFGEKNKNHVQDFFQAHMSKVDSLQDMAKELKDGGFEALIQLLLRELTALGMTDEDGAVLMEYSKTARFTQAQLDALRSICENHGDLLDSLTGSFEGWQNYAELLQLFLAISATYEESMQMLTMLQANSQGILADELEKIQLELENVNDNVLEKFDKKQEKGNGNNGNGNNGNGNNKKEEVQEDLTDGYGEKERIKDNFAWLMFGTMMDQLAYWDEGADPMLVMRVHNGLSMSMTTLLSGRALTDQNDDQALYTLNALKYLIKLRLLGEQSFAWFGNQVADPDEQYLSWLYWVNNTLNMEPEFESLDQYAGYMMTLLLEYRDSIYIRPVESEGSGTLPSVPEAPTATINYLTEKTVESFSSEYEYSFTGDLWIDGSGSPISLNPGTQSKYLWIRKKAADNVFASMVTKLTIPARPRVLGDVTVSFDRINGQYGLTGLAAGSYKYAMGKTDDAKKLTQSFTPDSSGSYRLAGKVKEDWISIRAEATPTAFASTIRHVATRIAEYQWMMKHTNESGYMITSVGAGTSQAAFVAANQANGFGECAYTPGESNTTDNVATGDKVELNTPEGPEEFTVVVSGDVDGNAAVDEADVEKMIDHVGKGKDKKLKKEYKEAGKVHKDREEDEEINIFDIYTVLDELMVSG